MRPDGKSLHPLLSLITECEWWKEARTTSYDVLIRRLNTINTICAPSRMTVMTLLRMMNTTPEGRRINQAHNKSPDCPLALLANKDV